MTIRVINFKGKEEVLLKEVEATSIKEVLTYPNFTQINYVNQYGKDFGIVLKHGEKIVIK
jgi:hypothetical protein